MRYTFRGGPLHDQSLEVDESRLESGKYNHVEWFPDTNLFTLVPSLKLHPYLPVGNEMIYCEPEQLIG